ncbi:MAG: NAD(P)/FAD-dependent oxidoreductase [Candidatus Aureabacteria bacterium]|nr:NAD(P)/FAD-dependent oxidoreductase [Candidatus Auribacterota bacterium]
MKYDYDLICIGLGPAGMAVSIMGSEMGLRVCAIEKDRIGGECMNVGCIPSKALLKTAFLRHAYQKLSQYGLMKQEAPEVADVFSGISQSIRYINDKKTSAMLHKASIILGEQAFFEDSHTVVCGKSRITAKKIFIATGTEPSIPAIPGLSDVEYHTNKNIFELKKMPRSMIIIGGGAIGCEMAQAFSRLGTKCIIIHADAHLIPQGDRDAGNTLEKYFNDEGIVVYNAKSISEVKKSGEKILLQTEDGLNLEAEALLVAAGRKPDFETLKLENAGIRHDSRCIFVNKYLQTNHKHIFAVGDCNGKHLLTHAAMHQGMIALMNSILPWPFKKNFLDFAVPWTIFTEPEISKAGLGEKELAARKIKYQVIETKYADYGAAIAEHDDKGFVRVYASSLGRIYGVIIVGRGSGEMINEWALAIQKKIRLHDIMLLQHSFPTMGFLSKRIAELWMMDKMKSDSLKSVIRFLY